MGSPPRRLQPLIESDKSHLSNRIFSGQLDIIRGMNSKGTRNLGNLSSINFRSHPAGYGPHAMVAVKSRDPEKMRHHRPLSSLQTLKKMDEKPEDTDIFSVQFKEKKARASPYLGHMKTQRKEELLMELGSIVNTVDGELSLEIKLKSMLRDISAPKKGRKGKKGKKGKNGKLVHDSDYKNGDFMASIDYCNQKGTISPFSMEDMDEDDMRMFKYSPSTPDSDVEIWSSKWGFEGIEIHPSSSATEARAAKLGMVLTEFENSQDFDGEFINLSPKSSYTDEFSFGPEMALRVGQNPDEENPRMTDEDGGVKDMGRID